MNVSQLKCVLPALFEGLFKALDNPVIYSWLIWYAEHNQLCDHASTVSECLPTHWPDMNVCPSVSMAEGSVSVAEVEASFQKFAVHGDTKATGKEMNGKNFVKLCKECHIIDGKNVTTTDVDIVFSKVK